MLTGSRSGRFSQIPMSCTFAGARSRIQICSRRWSRDYRLVSTHFSRPGIHQRSTFDAQTSLRPLPSELIWLTIPSVTLCDLINALLPDQAKKCKSVPRSFSKPPILSGRFASTSTWQYFSYGPIGDQIGRLILGRVCRESTGVDYEALGLCEALLGVLPEAAYVDLDFDAIAHALTFTAVWGAAGGGGGVAELAARDLRKLQEGDRLEVGTLQVEASTDPEELSLGGFLTVLGEDERPSKSAVNQWQSGLQID